MEKRALLESNIEQAKLRFENVFKELLDELVDKIIESVNDLAFIPPQTKLCLGICRTNRYIYIYLFSEEMISENKFQLFQKTSKVPYRNILCFYNSHSYFINNLRERLIKIGFEPIIDFFYKKTKYLFKNELKKQDIQEVIDCLPVYQPLIMKFPKK